MKDRKDMTEEERRLLLSKFMFKVHIGKPDDQFIALCEVWANDPDEAEQALKEEYLATLTKPVSYERW